HELYRAQVDAVRRRSTKANGGHTARTHGLPLSVLQCISIRESGVMAAVEDASRALISTCQEAKTS
ncbi:hypothetical protein ACP3WA_24990, partial [Salmonella enterica]|uniref:hypothetical protein n=1 Tax=Salmonella enterica TaxID=28901 RepID=UPI003CF54013